MKNKTVFSGCFTSVLTFLQVTLGAGPKGKPVSQTVTFDVYGTAGGWENERK